MRVLLSTIGSRGDVQPLVALAMQLKALGAEVHLCVPPDFREWIESFGLSVTPLGPELRSSAKTSASAAPPTAEQRRQMVEASVATQFVTLTTAAAGCDIIVGATALQIAAPSVAERMGIPYVFAAYCPAVLPSTHHAPPVLGSLGDAALPAPSEFARLWKQDSERFHALFGPALNEHRSQRGLTTVDDVRSYVMTNHPWLAADATLGTWPDPADRAVFQTGAWILPDDRPLGREIEAFLDAGDAPVYFGFGSMRAPGNLSDVFVQTARALGHRAIVSRGWADVTVSDNDGDCLVIGEVNQQALFKRVCAVVHHGGAGTTTAAARAGSPQVVIPQMYDQHYWAARIRQLGAGGAHAPGAPSIGSLKQALEHALNPEVVVRAQSLASSIRGDGALVAAQRLVAVG